MDDLAAIKQPKISMGAISQVPTTSSHATITEYLEKLLFPTLSASINKVIIGLICFNF
ncbi:hypothetical protein GW820_06975 [archaeon]|nr:hypothetical protein [archaeon]